MGIYDNLSHEMLTNLVQSNTQKYIDAKLSGEVDATEMTKLEEVVNELQSALASKTPVCNPVGQTPTQTPNYEMNRRLKELSDYFSKISEFGPGSNVTLFIKECERIYNIVVSDCKDLEKDFCSDLLKDTNGALLWLDDIDRKSSLHSKRTYKSFTFDFKSLYDSLQPNLVLEALATAMSECREDWCDDFKE